MTLSEPKATPEGRYTHLVVLNAAASRPDKLVTKHKRLPGASLQKVCAALVKRGLLAELTGVSPDPEVLHVKTELGMTEYAITPAGLAAIGVDADEPDDATTAPTGAADAGGATTPAAVAEARPTATTAPTRGNARVEKREAERRAKQAARAEDYARRAAEADAPTRPTATTAPTRGASLRTAAEAVLDAWDRGDWENPRHGLAVLIDRLRAALASPTRARREPGAPRKPREGTKQEAVLALLRREEGATIAQIIDATQWQSHSVRGFLAGLKRKGITVEVVERVRQVGPNREGAKGSYSVYRVMG
jgi:hypothetical protein